MGGTPFSSAAFPKLRLLIREIISIDGDVNCKSRIIAKPEMISGVTSQSYWQVWGNNKK